VLGAGCSVSEARPLGRASYQSGLLMRRSVVSEPRAVATGSRSPAGFLKIPADPVATARGSDTDRTAIAFDPERVKELGWHPFRVRILDRFGSGGLRYASTPGYFPSTLRVENSVDSSNMFLPPEGLLIRSLPLAVLTHPGFMLPPARQAKTAK